MITKSNAALHGQMKKNDARSGLTRRRATGAIAASAAGLCVPIVGGCSSKHAHDKNGQRVVLYSSVDDFVLREVVERFEAISGIGVDLLGDTEAVKTTGLLTRLMAETDTPRADVWWSSEPFGTERLARAGVLEPTELELPELRLDAEPGRLVANDKSWYGFGLRARVLGVREGRFEHETPPARLGDLTDSAYEGRVGMAQPAFGTTRGHMAALAWLWGIEGLKAWLKAMQKNGLVLFGSNSAVVRALAQGEIDIGLTDTDDVWSAQRNNWPVRAVFESVDDGTRSAQGQARGAGHASNETQAVDVHALPSIGPMFLAGTVGRVRNGPHPDQARTLMNFLLAGPAEEMLAASDMHTLAVRHGPFSDQESYQVPDGWLPDVQAVAKMVPDAMQMCQRILGRDSSGA